MYDLKSLTISSSNPCLIVYLVDQSYSMTEEFGNSRYSKSQQVADAINEIIYEVGLRCIGSSGELKNRFELAVIGYGKKPGKTQSAWEGGLSGKWVVSIKDIFDHPMGMEEERPIWVRPYANQDTPMTRAFENAKRLCSDWINWGNHMDCHPPIIINITDGAATDAGWNFEYLKSEVEQIKQLRTNFGNAKVFNIHISERTGDRVLFPDHKVQGDKYGNLLFDLSSNLDENMIRIANQKGYRLSNNAKGYVFNGGAHDLINFLNIGTPQ